jgi:hypothetical protein
MAAILCEDPKKVPSDELFSKIDGIWQDYKRVIVLKKN